MTTADDPRPRSSVRIGRIRGGERTWQVVVVATGDGEDDAREALRVAVDLDSQLAARYGVKEPQP